MRRTRHFAGVIGAAGIVVSPFMAPLAAQADDTLAPDVLDYAVEGDANSGNDDVPNLPVTRVVHPEDSVQTEDSVAEENFAAVEDSEGQENLAPTEDSAPADEYLTPVVSKRAVALDMVETDKGVVAFDIPDEVEQGLPASGELSAAEFQKLLDMIEPYALERFEWDGTTLSLGEWQWTLAPAVEEKPAGVAPVRDAGGNRSTATQEVVDRLNAWVMQRNTGAASVGVAAPVVQGSQDSAVEDVVPEAPEAPRLPVTGEDAAIAAPTDDSALSLAPLLGITGLVLGGGIGVVTLRKRLEFADSK